MYWKQFLSEELMIQFDKIISSFNENDLFSTRIFT